MLKSELEIKVNELDLALTQKEIQMNRMKTKVRDIRTEFARAFNWQKGFSYSNSVEYREATWEEIFVELGKLLATKNQSDLRDKVKNLDQIVSYLESQITTEK